MAQVETNSIELNKSPEIFSDGEEVSGNVGLKIADDLDVKEIRVEAQGVASVFLNTRKDSSNLTKKDQFFTWSKILAQEKLPVGFHEFTFKFNLPNEVPSSCIGTYGDISYGITLYLKTATECHVLAGKSFIVSSGLNLSFVPEAAAKIDLCKYKEMGWCCFDEVVSARWKVDSSGYVPRDVVTIRTFVEEDSCHPVKLEDTILYKVISYKADRKKKVERTEIARAVVGMMFKKDGSTERIEFLTIPETPITGSCRNRLIDLSYELEFKAEITGGASRELVATSEVYVGSIPMDLELMKSYIMTTFNQHRLRAAQVRRAIPSAPLAPFHDFCPSVEEIRNAAERHSPPPSYASAIGAGN